MQCQQTSQTTSYQISFYHNAMILFSGLGHREGSIYYYKLKKSEKMSVELSWVLTSSAEFGTVTLLDLTETIKFDTMLCLLFDCGRFNWKHKIIHLKRIYEDIGTIILD